MNRVSSKAGWNSIRERTARPRILKRPKHRISRLKIDPDALKVVYRLRSQGFTAYLTGAAVQNLMQGITPKDFDIVTDARPGQIKKRFRNAFIIGRRFRLAHIHFRDGKIIEVATFRRKLDPEDEDPLDPGGGYKKTYGTPQEDAFRRDITINALFYDVDTETVIDYVGGLKDLAARKIRIIGDPEERYSEDPVRMLRVIRHSVRLGFEIEKRTDLALFSCRHLLADCPEARLFEELNKDLSQKTPLVFEAYQKYGVLKYLLGRAGEEYDADPGLFSRLKTLLDIKERAEADGFRFSREEVFALVSWPVLVKRLEGDQQDEPSYIHDTVTQAMAGRWMPKGLRADSIQILILTHHLIRALRTGRMRWSWQRRSHYAQASRLCFMIEKHQATQEKDPFFSLFRSLHPLPEMKKRRRRRRKPRKGSRDRAHSQSQSSMHPRSKTDGSQSPG